jgi:hypothetical protein
LPKKRKERSEKNTQNLPSTSGSFAGCLAGQSNLICTKAPDEMKDEMENTRLVMYQAPHIVNIRHRKFQPSFRILKSNQLSISLPPAEAAVVDLGLISFEGDDEVMICGA